MPYVSLLTVTQGWIPDLLCLEWCRDYRRQLRMTPPTPTSRSEITHAHTCTHASTHTHTHTHTRAHTHTHTHTQCQHTKVIRSVSCVWQMYSCGSLAPKMRRGGCMDTHFQKPAEPWEKTEGLVNPALDVYSACRYIYVHVCSVCRYIVHEGA